MKLANTILCPEFIQGTGRNKLCFISYPSSPTYVEAQNAAAAINARIPYAAELFSAFSLNGYNANNRPYPTDKWTPILDRFNDWMQIGDTRFGVLHCGGYGCPSWGVNKVNLPHNSDIGVVCLGYWNPSYTSCLSCMATCFSCPNNSSCNEFCYEIYPQCQTCNPTQCLSCIVGSGYYYQPNSPTCLTTCPNTHHQTDLPTPVCTICADTYPNC